MSSNRGRHIAKISSLFLIASVFTTWGSALGVDVTGSGEVIEVAVRGIGGKDGILILGVAVVAIILLLIKKIPIWIPLVLGIFGFIISFVDLFAMRTAVGQVDGEIGWGLYLALLASVGISVGAIMQIVDNKRK